MNYSYAHRGLAPKCINTTGWKSGVYIIRSIINDKMLSEKVVIK